MNTTHEKPQFAGQLIYTDPEGLRWKIERKRGEKSRNRYWHASLIGGTERYISISCQRLLGVLDHPELRKGEAQTNGR